MQHPFMTIPLNKVSVEGTYLNIIKTIYYQPTANINVEKLKTFKIRNKTGCPLLLLLFNIVLTGSPNQSSYTTAEKKAYKSERKKQTVHLQMKGHSIHKILKGSTKKPAGIN